MGDSTSENKWSANREALCVMHVHDYKSDIHACIVMLTSGPGKLSLSTNFAAAIRSACKGRLQQLVHQHGDPVRCCVHALTL
jgi:hypothetical protein